MNVALTPAFPDHIPELHAVALQSYREHYRYLWTSEDYARWYMDRSFSLHSLKKQMAEPGSSFYMVHYGEHPCGFIKINWNHHLHDDKNSSELERIYLLQDYSGRGIGAAVMQ